MGLRAANAVSRRTDRSLGRATYPSQNKNGGRQDYFDALTMPQTSSQRQMQQRLDALRRSVSSYPPPQRARVQAEIDDLQKKIWRSNGIIV